MATKNSLFSRFALSSLFIFIISACQTVNHRENTPAHIAGPEINQPSSTLTPVPPPPPPTKEEPKKVAIILGPGGAKAMAHVGVLRALQQQRIPINKVVGIEWGALVGGLFAAKGQVHDVEWKLYKMEQKNIPRPRGGFFSKTGYEEPFKIMDDYMQDVFGNEDIAGDKIAFTCPSRSIWSGVVSWQTRGLAREAMKRCMTFPPIFKASGTFIAGASQALEAVEQLRTEGYNVIILVNVLGSAMPVAQDSLLDNLNYVILWQEIRRATLEASHLAGVDVINVDTGNYPVVAFDAKKDLISAGEIAGNKAAAQLVNKYGF